MAKQNDRVEQIEYGEKVEWANVKCFRLVGRFRRTFAIEWESPQDGSVPCLLTGIYC